MAGQRCLNRVNFYKRSLLIKVPCPTIQPIPTPTTPNKFILTKITLSERMTVAVMRLNKTENSNLTISQK
jgi:hypothetical protein